MYKSCSWWTVDLYTDGLVTFLLNSFFYSFKTFFAVCHVSGEDYLVGMSWNRLNTEGNYFDLCSCSHKKADSTEIGLTEVNCVYQSKFQK